MISFANKNMNNDSKIVINIGEMDIHLADGNIHFWAGHMSYSIHVGVSPLKKNKTLRDFIALLRKMSDGRFGPPSSWYKDVNHKFKSFSVIGELDNDNDDSKSRYYHIFIDSGNSRMNFMATMDEIDSFANYLECQ